MDKCYLCRQKRKKAKLLNFGFLCHSCFPRAKQVVEDFGLVGYATAIAIINQVGVRDYSLATTGARNIGNPLYWNQKRRKK